MSDVRATRTPNGPGTTEAPTEVTGKVVLFPTTIEEGWEEWMGWDRESMLAVGVVMNVSDFNRRGKVQRKWENHLKSPDSIYIQTN